MLHEQNILCTIFAAMISKRLKYFSIFMAVLMLTTSVGITAKVHYCFMENQPATSIHKEEKCCVKKEVMSCCEMCEQPCADVLNKEKGCCSDEVKSFSLAKEFVNKIVSVLLTQFFTLLSYGVTHHFADAGEQHSFEAKNIFTPPKLSGTALLYFKQILNL